MTRTQSVATTPLPWHGSLLFRLGLLFVLLAALAAIAAYLTNRNLIQDGLTQGTQRYRSESGQRLAVQYDGVALRVQNTASILVQLAVNLPDSLGNLRQVVPQLVDHLGADSGLIANVGIWPEPNTLDPSRQRASLLWVRDASSTLQLREDYNDARTVPYNHEKWYTPARYQQADRCYWTPVYQEPLSRQNVITCTMPIVTAHGYSGAVTVSLSLDNLAIDFTQATQSDSGYSLLLDSDNQLLAFSANSSRIESGHPRNLAALAQAQPAYNPLALMLHQRDLDQLASANRSATYKAADASTLQHNTRDMSQLEAQAALTQIWLSQNDHAKPGAAAVLHLDDDPVLGGDSDAAAFTLPGSHWQLLRFTPGDRVFSGPGGLFTQSMSATVIIFMLALLLIFIAVNFMVVAPLSRIHAQLMKTHDLEQTLKINLEERSGSEIGRLARWLNERLQLMRDTLLHVSSSQAQLTAESGGRRTAQDALTRVQERNALLLQTVSDGVIITNDQGRVEDMNSVAEQLTGNSLRNSRSRNFSDIFKAFAADGTVLPNLAMQAIHDGRRIDLDEPVRLARANGEMREISAIATPFALPDQRATGALIVFHEQLNVAAGGTAAVRDEPLASDRETGLLIRSGCYRNINDLIAAAHRKPAQHALLSIDIDQLRQINEAAGLMAGNKVIVKISELLVSCSARSGEVYRTGGGQFAVLLENCDGRKAEALAETLRKMVAGTHLKWETHSFAVTVSIGVMLFDANTANAADVLRGAEDACQLAKKSGRNAVKLWSPDNAMQVPPKDSLWMRRIRAGLNQNLFHLTTQFILAGNATSGQAYAVNLTLEDEEGFWSTAAAFMPTAERHHLTLDMDRWAISQTIAQLERNPELAQRTSLILMRASAESLAEPALLEHIVRTFEHAPTVSPASICFELTQESIDNHQQSAQTFCDSMRGIGCRLLISHFNARRGSDLDMLRRLPFDFVKIDGRQYRQIAQDAVEQMLAESTVRVARSLHKQIIVNNLEENSQLAAWQKLKADFYQGFIVAKPTPVIFTAPV
ncbi:MAG: EAL domain-containing protein [Stenotrophobium sp.]